MKGVTLTTITADLNDYPIEPVAWDVIIDFFCHCPPASGCRCTARDCGAQARRAYILEVFARSSRELRQVAPPATWSFGRGRRDGSWQVLTCASCVSSCATVTRTTPIPPSWR